MVAALPPMLAGSLRFAATGVVLFVFQRLRPAPWPEARPAVATRYAHVNPALAVLLGAAVGGRLYVGGTSIRNAPMLALFQKLGAEPFRTVERWAVSPDGRDAPTGAPSRP